MRLRVESLVSTFLAETWTAAKHSISVNGLDASSVPDLFTPQQQASTSSSNTTELEGQHFTYMPYDPRLSTKLASLYAELESLTSEVSNLRRTNPREGAEGYLSALNSTLEDDEAVYASQRDEAARPPDEEVLKISSIPSDAPELYERGLGSLAGLSGLGQKAKGVDGGGGGKKKQGSLSLTETVGKVQRARRVVGELE